MKTRILNGRRKTRITLAIAGIAAATFHGSCGVAKLSERELGATDVSVSFEVVEPASIHKSLVVSIRNTSRSKGAFRMPKPFSRSDLNKEGSPHRYLLLEASVSGAKQGQQFALTSLAQTEPPQKEPVVLEPDESCAETFRCDAFYRWGPGGPDDSSFDDYFSAGSDEVQLKVRLISGRNEPPIESRCEIYRFSFPEWMFVRPADRK